MGFCAYVCVWSLPESWILAGQVVWSRDAGERGGATLALGPLTLGAAAPHRERVVIENVVEVTQAQTVSWD